MPDPVMQIQRKAMAIDRALEASYENAVTLGLPPGVLEDLKAERPLVSDEDTVPVIVAELADALAAERRQRQELGHAFGELLERVEAMEKK